MKNYFKIFFSFYFFYLVVALKGQSTQRCNDINRNDIELNKQISFNMKGIPYHPDAKLSITELTWKYKYPMEIHTIRTEDNYLLTVHRIPYGKQNRLKKNRRPILLIHGIFENSASWIYMGPKRSLGFLLADMGYDVWIGNARGNKYSRSHVFLDPDRDPERFWDFSWHEIGIYDLPATIDYILERTNKKKIHYVGHSQGCTTFFVMTSLRPEYNKKIANMFALAPAVFLGNTKSPLLKYAGKYISVSKFILKCISKYEVLPSRGFLIKNLENFCGKTMWTQRMCENALYLVTGYDKDQMDSEKMPVIFRNTSAGCSSKQLVHFLQSARSDTNSFSFYDYGTEKNIDIYQSFHPPAYPLKKVTTPVALFSAYNDLFADVKDVDTLELILPNVMFNYRVSFQEFTHMDFLWAKDVVSLVYNEIFKQLKKYDHISRCLFVSE